MDVSLAGVECVSGRYWYNQGLLQPDKIVNAIVAIDRNTEENGCMRLLSRSHKLGRIEHGKFAGQMCANPSLVAEAMRLPGFELTSLTMQPGVARCLHLTAFCLIASTVLRYGLLQFTTRLTNEFDKKKMVAQGTLRSCTPTRCTPLLQITLITGDAT